MVFSPFSIIENKLGMCGAESVNERYPENYELQLLFLSGLEQSSMINCRNVF